MSFHDVRFPARLSLGATGGPERRTRVVTLASGHEERNTPWAHSRRRYDAGTGLRAPGDIATLVAFFEARRGMLHGFRWKDWSDFTSGLPGQIPDYQDQLIATADGTEKTFRLTKTYGQGADAYTRPIAKPVAGTVTIGVTGDPLEEGRDFTVDTATGMVTLADVPVSGALITAGFEFDVPVRFDTDRLDVALDAPGAARVPDIPVVELRLD